MFGVGVMTMLIVGMAQLVAPFFALQRVQSKGMWLIDNGVFWLLSGAVGLRAITALLRGQLEVEPRMHLNAAAGVLAWTAIAVFAATVHRAIRREGGIKAALAGGVVSPASRR
jgi:hypothetical protein